MSQRRQKEAFEETPNADDVFDLERERRRRWEEQARRQFEEEDAARGEPDRDDGDDDDPDEGVEQCSDQAAILAAATVAALRYAHKGIDRDKAEELIRKRFRVNAEAVVSAAYRRYAQYKRGKRVGHLLTTDLKSLHKRYARLEVSGQPCAIVLRGRTHHQ